jgi:hypothetical protein
MSAELKRALPTQEGLRVYNEHGFPTIYPLKINYTEDWLKDRIDTRSKQPLMSYAFGGIGFLSLVQSFRRQPICTLVVEGS